VWADKVVDAIGPQPDDRFLEIGAGPGALTVRLAPRVARLTAIEVDRDLAAALRPKLPPHAELLVADVLDVDLISLLGAGPWRVAGNLPYNLTSPILLHLIAAARTHSGMRDATLMVQREVADRIAAAPGGRDYGVLSISIQLYADVERVLVLPPGAFRPGPQVYSAVVRLTFRPPPVELHDPALFEGVVRAAFAQRRKTLAGALRGFAERRGQRAAAVLARAGIEPSRRAETLQLTELARLVACFSEPEP